MTTIKFLKGILFKDNGNDTIMESSAMISNCGVTGLKKIEKVYGMLVSPNPTTGEVWLDNYSLSGKEGVQIKIYNYCGELINSYITNSFPTNIDLSANPAGIYLIGTDAMKPVKIVRQ